MDNFGQLNPKKTMDELKAEQIQDMKSSIWERNEMKVLKRQELGKLNFEVDNRWNEGQERQNLRQLKLVKTLDEMKVEKPSNLRKLKIQENNG